MTKPLDFSIIPVMADADTFLEKRFAYTGVLLEYEGWNRTPSAATSSPTWFIVKYTYAGTDRTRRQLPEDGPKFTYVWDDRATYF